MISPKKLIKILGPGLLYAGAAIGVSHLVQSTRAGASYGFELIGIIIIANVLKYPFFEFAPRYAAATGNSLIKGYSKLGLWAVWIYALVTIATMFITQAGVTIVTAGLFSYVFGLHLPVFWISTVLLVLSLMILLIGRYNLLDKVIKYIIILLALSTFFAVISAIVKQGYSPDIQGIKLFDLKSPVDVAFLIAFFGWMPGPIDISVWQSLWAEAKNESLKKKISLKDALLDFNIGYIATVFLAIGFLSLGAILLYGSNIEFSASSSKFAGELISLFTSSIGRWAYPIIATAALATMFSTTLTCFDAYSRSMVPAVQLSFPNLYFKSKQWTKKLSLIWMLILLVGTIVLLKFFATNMRQMVDFATTVSFVLAPILAFLNLKVVTHAHMPKWAKPRKLYLYFALVSLALLSLFSLYFLYWKFILN